MSNELEKMNIRRLSNKESNRVTKECIRSAMIGLMEEYSYEKINMTMIINRSGASRASVYRNYPSKEDIMIDITKKFTEELSESLARVLHHDTDTRDWLVKVFERLQSDKNMCILARNSNLPFVDLFFVVLCQASEKDILPEDEYKIRGFAAGLWEIIMTWIKNGMIGTPEKMADICSTLFKV
ncbi:MAG: TetR/AcrR family transcriptional regulator [Lachnospiraceae bacterium]|nr:TetR/AcrR family transcriptional regulator [Lachnospiraceae bacterium]